MCVLCMHMCGGGGGGHDIQYVFRDESFLLNCALRKEQIKWGNEQN